MCRRSWRSSLLVAAVWCAAMGNCAKLLALFPLQRDSHFATYEPLLKRLAFDGHQIDVVSHFPQPSTVITPPRYTDLPLGNFTGEQIEELDVSTVERYNWWAVAQYVFAGGGASACDRLFASQVARRLRDSPPFAKQRYDLVLVELHGSDCALGFGQLWGAPLVALLGDDMLPWVSDRMGNPDNPSYMPNYLLPYDARMSLAERSLNALSGMLYKLGYQFMSLHSSELKSRRFFGPRAVPLDLLAYNTSLLLVNTHFSVDVARPLVPAVIEVAGLHIDKPRPLPKDLIPHSDSKFVYVVLTADRMPERDVELVVRALSSLSVKVIVRGSPSTRLLTKRLPENARYDGLRASTLDVLCDGSAGALLTHGDVLLLHEAVHCAIPVVGIPLTAAQHVRIERYARRHLAVNVRLHNLTEPALTQALRNVLDDPSYRTSIRAVSAVFRDRPIPPLDTAVYWLEYVLRHAPARILRPVGADLIWMEYYNVDVALVFFVVIAAIVTLFYMLFILLGKLFAPPVSRDKLD